MLDLPKYLFINGPPGSGKSTLAKMLCEHNPRVWNESFAEPIREMLRAVFFPSNLYDSPNFRDQTIKTTGLLSLAGIDNNDGQYGITVRNTMIDFSEKFLKPRFGADIFGRLLHKRCLEQAHWYDHFIIDDSGFVAEAEYVISQEGASACVLLRLHRDGCDFSADSRGYIDLAIRTLDLYNNGTEADLLDTIQLNFGHL